MKDAHTWNRTRVTKATIWCTATVLCELLVLSLLHSLFSLPLIPPFSTDSFPPHKVAVWTAPPRISLFCSKIHPPPPPLISPIIFIRSPFLSTDRGQGERGHPILVIESPSSGFSMTLLPVGDCFLCPHGSHRCDRRLIAHLTRILRAFISDWINF